MLLLGRTKRAYSLLAQRVSRAENELDGVVGDQSEILCELSAQQDIISNQGEQLRLLERELADAQIEIAELEQRMVKLEAHAAFAAQPDPEIADENPLDTWDELPW